MALAIGVWAAIASGGTAVGPLLGGALLVALIVSMSLIGFELVLSQHLQFVIGKSPLEAGAYALLISPGSFFAGPLTGALIGRAGSVRVIVAGLA